MKLTKKLEAEILKTYNSYWENYLKGDVEAMHPLLADDYTQVGSAESEVFSNKKDAVQFLYDTIDQVAGKLEMRNRKTTLEQHENGILIHEFCDLFALSNNNWIFYSKFRASSFLQPKKGSWKFIHQHSSFPDSKSEEGQNIAIDKIAEENQQLREAVKRRTIELEYKNRELEIETALEKVRAKAMGMKRANDMLSICKTIAHQLAKLGIKEIRNVQTAIFYENRGTYINYEYYAKHDKTFITEVNFKNHKIQSGFAKKMMKGPNEEVQEHLKGKKLQDWYAYQKTTNQFADKFLLKAHSLNYYWYSLGPVALGTSTYNPLTKNETDLFKRFLKVFELAYRRYLDIEKATAQATEAQLEASLEKVRAQALGMRKPEDLPNVCEVLYKELQALGFAELRNAMVNIHNNDQKTFVNYDYSDEIGKSITPLFNDIHPVIKKQIKKIRSADDAFSETVFKGKDLESWKTFRKSRGEKTDKRIDNSTALYYYFYSIGTGSIGISTFHQIAKEKQEVLKRFRNVFAFAYRRYMDVAKAEAQAKEAQIELGLERVRARAMAMQHSEELAELVTVVFKELTQLNFHITSSIIWINNPETISNTLWVTSTEMNQPARPIHLTPFQHPFFHSIIHAWKEKDPKWIYVLTGKEKSSFEKSFFKGAPGLPKALKSALSVPENVVFSATFNHFGALELIGTEPLTDEKFEILHRFGKVFDSSYTRFNDLKKAEAQAKESQIQLAMERVRARTMAMQKSDELPDAANLLFLQVQAMGMPAWSAGYCTWDDDKKSSVTLSMSSEGVLQPKLSMPLTEDPSLMHFREAWERGESFFVEEVGGEELKRHYAYLRTLPGVKETLDDIEKAGFPVPTFQIFHLAYFTKGFLLFITYEPVPESHDIFKRFAKVFEQTYTRFLDLQKAEAQAREAEIELGLERVRARAMAMQKSDELSDLVDAVFKELTKLDFALNWCIINIIDEPSLTNMVWAANPETNKPPESYLMKFEDYPFHHSMLKAYQERKTKHVYVIEGKEKKTYDHYLFTETEWRRVPKAAQDASRAMKRYVATFTFSNFGGLQTVGEEYLSEENLEILSRFGKVFDLTYTRFNDLQKAEAQAREAQIEAALERVRSRSMAMHKSEELANLSLELVKQVQALGVATWFCAFNIYDDAANSSIEWGSNGIGVFSKYQTPREGVFLRYYEAGQRGETLLVNEIGEDECSAHYEYLCSLPGVGDQLLQMKEAGIPFPKYQIDHVAFFKQGYLIFITYEPVPETHDIFKRFARVFEQSYTRFLDLKNAEAQAREAQIEAALERVRSRSMAMHNSDELLEAGEILFSEMQKLGIESLTAGFVLIDKEEKNGLNYTPDPYTKKIMSLPVIIPHDETIHMKQVVENWEKGSSYFVVEMDEEETIKHQTFIAERSTNFTLNAEQLIAISPAKLFLHNFYFKEGYLLIVGGARLSTDQIDIMLRFAKVFQQTYTRFLDLQKAEAQAREAQIEAALEKVRSRSLAMQKPEELLEVAEVLRREMGQLGVEELETSSIYLVDKENEHAVCWYAIKDIRQEHTKLVSDEMTITFAATWVGNEMGKFYGSKKESTSIMMKGDNRKEWINYCAGLSNVLQGYYGDEIPERTYHLVKFNGGYMGAASPGNISAESWDLLRRAAVVFSLAYTRFKDLQDAAERTREAQIELALERVRSKTMAMHNSQDVGDTVATLFDQLVHLGVITNRCGILIFSNTNNTEVWTAKSNPTGEAALIIGHLDVSIHPMLQGIRHAWKNKETFYSYELAGDDIKNYYSAINNYPDYPTRFNLDNLPGKEIHSDFYFPEGAVFAFTSAPIADEASLIFKRFAGVFGQTYRRYLDLQKAEAAAREATIEAALEKVRGKAMAMHNSNDLSVTASMVFTELRKLGIHPIRCGVGLLNNENRKAQIYSATYSAEGDSLSLVGWAQLADHPVLEKIYNSWQHNKDYFPHLTGEELKTYYENLLSGFPIPADQFATTQKQYGHFIPFSVGCLYAWSEKEFTADQLKIFKRFAAIIDLTFRRYLELQKSEANARETVKQAALDRIRADIASMRTITDLDRITPLIWNELTILGVPFIRCGAFLMDEEQQLIHTFLSTPDGKAIAAFHLPYKTPGNFTEVVNHWYSKQLYIDHWGEPEFINMADTLVKQGAIEKKEQYLNTLPQGGFYLHFLPFLQGMLYVANTTQLNDDEIQLIQSVADAFSTAYARYEDFNKLEAAKATVEKTLTDLKQTQAQLVQSEKMASLGELTAGIAHEIQNPLNFVNNFSEVSSELIKELVEEVDKGNTELVKALADDVVQNLEKINHHGKRAADIVKGMLQHSRSGSGAKEPTDINALADEYLRLAYHGLRAKDKTFNASLKTDFDPNIGHINIIPQDIGRVILNLITNAFYVVNTPQPPKGGVEHVPTVSVSTKKSSGRIEIKVSDNGEGIPNNILDKIFQPFFTTKPTGQGTGLGLSLSYDIVKAHGGELRVETIEGEGSDFIIELPIV